MKRIIEKELINWLNSESRKPLIFRGARQVGKTWAVRKLAQLTGRKLIEFNFEKQRSLRELFAINDPTKIIQQIESYLNERIDIQNTLLFLDEIQAAPELIAKLRWFYEDMPQLPVVAAGSLLEFALSNYPYSMPVGRVSYLNLEPLSFDEFLLARDRKLLHDHLKEITFKEKPSSVVHHLAMELFREYILVGGLPEVVKTWCQSESFVEVSRIQRELIAAYQDDFSKYGESVNVELLEKVLRAVPRQLGNTFMYSKVSRETSSTPIKKSLTLLCCSKLCRKVYATSANGIPLGAEKNDRIFKLYLLDTGLVSAMLDLRLQHFANIEEIDLYNKGAIAEQVVSQLLACNNQDILHTEQYFWQRSRKGATAEIDYILQYASRIIPIEVKAGAEGKLKSLHVFMAEKKYPLAIRIYSGELKLDTVKVKTPSGQPVRYQLLSIPFYLLSQLERLINLQS